LQCLHNLSQLLDLNDGLVELFFISVLLSLPCLFLFTFGIGGRCLLFLLKFVPLSLLLDFSLFEFIFEKNLLLLGLINSRVVSYFCFFLTEYKSFLFFDCFLSFPFVFFFLLLFKECFLFLFEFEFLLDLSLPGYFHLFLFPF